MEKVKTTSKWIFQDFFRASIFILSVTYLFWFWLEIDINLLVAVFFFLFYIALVALYHTVKLNLLRLIALIFLLVNVWFLAYAFPTIGDVAFHNGTIYILTHHSDITSDSPLSDFSYEEASLTKSKWGIIPVRYTLGRWMLDEHLVYDSGEKVVGVLRLGVLTYLDGNPPLDFQPIFRNDENQWFYLNSVCLDFTPPNLGYSCGEYKHTIYQCNKDNTGCVMLPMQYTGTEWEGDLVLNESTGELDYFVTHDTNNDPTTYILVFSYGAHPRCYVEGCKILNTP